MDVEVLRTIARLQDAEIERLHAKVTALTRALAAAQKADAATVQKLLIQLDEELREARDKYRKGGSERRPRKDIDRPKPEGKPRTGHGPKPQPRLPIRELPVHVLDEADKVCNGCGGGLQVWEGQFEESEEINVVDVQYVINKHRRQKYRCGCGGPVETAPGPQRLVKGGRYSLEFAVQVAIQKYCDHLPLERQVRIMARAMLDVDSQTLWDQLQVLSSCFTVAIKELHQHLLKKDVLMADETRWPLLGVADRPTTNWFDWVLVGEDGVLHSILDSRSNEAGDRILTGFKGTLLTDAFMVYESRAKALGFKNANEWCHARRYFLKAEATSAEEARAILDDIGKLFMIEREIVKAYSGKSKEQALAMRLRIRQEQSKPIVEAIKRRAMQIRALRESPIGRAVRYLQNQWTGLIRFLDHPGIPLTSNLAEAALRCLVLGRNNHFGSRSKRGTEVAAMFYSLIESARLNGLDPRAYLLFGAKAHLRGEHVPLPHELREACLGTGIGPRIVLPASTAAALPSP